MGRETDLSGASSSRSGPQPTSTGSGPDRGWLSMWRTAWWRHCVWASSERMLAAAGRASHTCPPCVGLNGYRTRRGRDQRTARPQTRQRTSSEPRKAYAAGQALIADPEIDVVTVATRVPDHRALVLAALAAGKHVYSEWPLGRSSAEAGGDGAGCADCRRACRDRPAVAGEPGCEGSAGPASPAGSIGRLLSVSVALDDRGLRPTGA